MKSVLVTGSTGFIGSHLVERLLERGVQVRTLARPGGGSSRTSHANLEVFRAPLTVQGVTDAAKGCDVVFHLAGITRASTPEEFLWANAEGTRAAAVGAQKNGSRLVYVSSLAAAGTGTPEQPRRVSDTPEPITSYGQSKLEGEVRVRETSSLDWCIVRPPGVYGPRDKDFLFVFQAAQRGFFPILGNPNRAYTLVYVDDLVNAIISCGERPEATGKTYFVGHHDPVPYNSILKILALLMGREYRPITLPNAVLEIAAGAGEMGRIFGQVGLINRSRQKDLQAPGWVCDVTDIERDLGFKCETALVKGFTQTLEWYKREKWL
jgi:nucleoside-diphosphate-sugar epimerase